MRGCFINSLEHIIGYFSAFVNVCQPVLFWVVLLLFVFQHEVGLAEVCTVAVAVGHVGVSRDVQGVFGVVFGCDDVQGVGWCRGVVQGVRDGGKGQADLEIRLVVRGDVDVVAPGGDGFVLCGVSPEKMFIRYVVASMQVGEDFGGECDGVDHGGLAPR